MTGPETTQSLATHLRRMADSAGDQIDADRLLRAADLVEAPQAPRVKPLVWHRADLSAWGEYANAGLLRYRMTWTYRAEPEVWFVMRCDHNNDLLYEGGDEQSAKAAAQSDHEARVLAALDLTPDPKVAALVEAAEPLAAMAERYDPPDGDDDLECWSGLAVPKIKHIRALRAALAALKGGNQ